MTFFHTVTFFPTATTILLAIRLALTLRVTYYGIKCLEKLSPSNDLSNKQKQTNKQTTKQEQKQRNNQQTNKQKKTTTTTKNSSHRESWIALGEIKILTSLRESGIALEKNSHPDLFQEK